MIEKTKYFFLVKKAAEGARLRGAAKIIGVDLNPDKFEIGLVGLSNLYVDGFMLCFFII